MNDSAWTSSMHKQMCGSTTPCALRPLWTPSKMLFPEDYHNVSLVFKAAQLMKQQPTRVAPGEHKLYFNLLHLHVWFYCWVGCAWHRSSLSSWPGCHFYFLGPARSLEENVALSCFVSFRFHIAFWKASRCSVWASSHLDLLQQGLRDSSTWSKENTPVKTGVLAQLLASGTDFCSWLRVTRKIQEWNIY